MGHNVRAFFRACVEERRELGLGLRIVKETASSLNTKCVSWNFTKFLLLRAFLDVSASSKVGKMMLKVRARDLLKNEAALGRSFGLGCSKAASHSGE